MLRLRSFLLLAMEGVGGGMRDRHRRRGGREGRRHEHQEQAATMGGYILSGWPEIELVLL